MTCDEARLDLDAYALGALDADGLARLEAHLAMCSDCARELAGVQGVADRLSLSVPLQRAPAGMREAVMASLHQPAAVIRFPRSSSPAMRRGRSVRRALATPLRRRFVMPLLAAAAVAAVAFLGYRVSVLQAQIDRLQRQASAAVSSPADVAYRNAVLMLAMPGTFTGRLAPRGPGPAAWGSVIWNPAQGQCMVLATRLQRPPAGYEYRVVFSEDGTHWDGGRLNVDANGFGQAVVSTMRWNVAGGYEVIVALQQQGGQDGGSTVLAGDVYSAPQ